MNLYDNILSFKGTWRRYQERVLNSCDAYLSDGKITYCSCSWCRKDNFRH